MQAVVGNGDVQRAAGVSGNKLLAGRRLGVFEGLQDQRGGDDHQCRQTQ